jgi:hypothetical protein
MPRQSKALAYCVVLPISIPMTNDQSCFFYLIDSLILRIIHLWVSPLNDDFNRLVNLSQKFKLTHPTFSVKLDSSVSSMTIIQNSYTFAGGFRRDS